MKGKVRFFVWWSRTVALGITVLFLGVSNAFAAGGQLTADVATAQSAIQQVMTWIMGLTPPAAGLGIAYVSFLHSFTENENDAYTKRKWRTRILVSAAIVFLAAGIADFVTGIFKG